MSEQDIQNSMEEMRREHATEIIDFLAAWTGDNLTECLSIARGEYDFSHSELWLAVYDGLAALCRQAELQRLSRPSPYRGGIDELPF